MAVGNPPRPSVLMVSKPIAPPWSDSSKNLVRDLVGAGRRFDYRILTPRGYRLEQPSAATTVHSEPIYGHRGRFAPGLRQNAQVLRRLLQRDDTRLSHFFFAPNPRTSWVARALLLARRRATVQTVCSIPASFRGASQLLFADRVIVLSQETRRRFVAAGVAEQRLHHIPPGIALPPLLSQEARARVRRHFGLPAQARIAIYPGDYELDASDGPGPAETFARAIRLVDDPTAFFVLACRIKVPAARATEARIEALLRSSGVRQRVLMLNEVEEMLPLLAACDVCALPADDLYAKMDIPLVLLEALALELPIIVADRAPLDELVSGSQIHGIAVPPQDPAALAAALRTLLSAGRQSAARTLVSDRFAIGEIARRHEDLYLELLEAR